MSNSNGDHLYQFHSLQPPQPLPTPQPSTSATAQSLPSNLFGQPLPRNNVVPQLHVSVLPSNHIPPHTQGASVSQTSIAGSLNISEVRNHLDSLNGQSAEGDDNEINQLDCDDDDDVNSLPQSIASGSVRAADNPDIGFGQSVLNDVSSGFDLSQSHSGGSGRGLQNVSGASIGYNSAVASDSEASITGHQSLNQSAGVTEREKFPVIVTPQDQPETVTQCEKEELNNFETASNDELHALSVSVANAMPLSSQSQQAQTSAVTVASSMPPSSQHEQAQTSASLSPLAGQSIHLSTLPQAQGAPILSVPPLSNGRPSSLPSNHGAGLSERPVPWKMSDGPPPRATGPDMRTTSIEQDTATGSTETRSNNDVRKSIGNVMVTCGFEISYLP